MSRNFSGFPQFIDLPGWFTRPRSAMRDDKLPSRWCNGMGPIRDDHPLLQKNVIALGYVDPIASEVVSPKELSSCGKAEKSAREAISAFGLLGLVSAACDC
jgi:hypothetical protein